LQDSAATVFYGKTAQIADARVSSNSCRPEQIFLKILAKQLPIFLFLTFFFPDFVFIMDISDLFFSTSLFLTVPTEWAK
jgi:hypothetical protein